MSWYVVPIIGVFLLGVLLVDLAVIFYYEHPDDSKYTPGLVAKVTALAGLEFLWLLLVTLPTDAFNTRSDKDLDMHLFWAVALLFSSIFIILPIPLASKFYLADTDPLLAKRPPWAVALQHGAIVCFSCIGVYVPSYFGLRSCTVTRCIPGGSPDDCYEDEVITPFLLFSAIFIGFIGWILNTIYLSVGLVAVPQGLIVGFMDRPKPISQEDYNEAKSKIGEEIVLLKAVGEHLRERGPVLKSMKMGVAKWNGQRSLRNDLNKFRQSVHVLEQTFEALNVSFKQRGENPFISYVKLVLGFFCGILSLVWYIHIILNTLMPQVTQIGIIAGGFLDGLLQIINKAQFFGLDLLLFEFFVGYLMICQMVGCFRFNSRTFFCFSIHPMKKHDTHANSILFNTALTLISGHGITHQAYVAFRGYCKGSFSEHLYDEYAKNTPILGVFYKYNVFVWITAIWIIVVFAFYLVKPREEIAFNLDRIMKMKGKVKENKPVNSAPETEGGEKVQEKVGGFLQHIDQTATKKVGQLDKAVKFFL